MSDTSRAAVLVIRDEGPMSMGELCRCCDLAADQLLDMVGEGLLQPTGSDPRRWRFSLADMYRIQRAVRLQRDLGVNLAGAVLALELMDDMQQLRKRLQLLEQLQR